jgi:hypothetical protein
MIYLATLDVHTPQATGWWFSPDPLVSSTNTTDRHDIAEILLKVALNTIKQTYIPEEYEHLKLPNISYFTL